MNKLILTILFCVPIVGLYGNVTTATCHSNVSDKIWIFPSYLAGFWGEHCYLPESDEDGTFR